MNTVIKRKVFRIQVQLNSPLNVSSGDNQWTDADVLRDFDGKPFVPGTSLAGAMRAYIEKSRTERCLFGYSSGDAGGQMSPLFISDLTFEESPAWGIRDGVALNANKTAGTGSKYDMEILEPGLNGHFYMELVVREKDRSEEEDWQQELATIFKGLCSGEIRLGYKKTRGFGKIKIRKLATETFEGENYLSYADAYKDSFWESVQDELETWLQMAGAEDKMLHIEVPLRMHGGISIRQYAARKNEPDFVQLTSNGEPVIPGSSLTGAIRHRVEVILEELSENGAELPASVTEMTDRMFGFVRGNDAHASNIIVSEAKIRDAKPLTIVRTGISRFESSVKDGALYKERTYVDGYTNVNIAIRKKKESDSVRWMAGILLLALKDLQNGYLAVGGQTAVGRGVFALDGELRIDGETGREALLIAEALQYMKMR